jgi:predicted ATP-dependent serine protease
MEGKCDNCGAWDTITEIRIVSKKTVAFASMTTEIRKLPTSFHRLLLMTLHGSKVAFLK